MIFEVWEIFFLLILVFCLILGVLKGFLRTLTMVSAHLFSSALAIVFSPSVTGIVLKYLDIKVDSHFFTFIILYTLPMILMTQLFRAMYKRSSLNRSKKISLTGRIGGALTGLFLGIFFSFLFTWILILQPFLPVEGIYSWGGTFFTQAAQLLQIFMRFYV